jgi:hypothetical protein
MSALRAASETRRSMDSYPKAAMERGREVQDVMLQAMAKKITWWQAAEIFACTIHLLYNRTYHVLPK